MLTALVNLCQRTGAGGQIDAALLTRLHHMDRKLLAAIHKGIGLAGSHNQLIARLVGFAADGDGLRTCKP